MSQPVRNARNKGNPLSNPLNRDYLGQQWYSFSIQGNTQEIVVMSRSLNASVSTVGSVEVSAIHELRNRILATGIFEMPELLASAGTVSNDHGVTRTLDVSAGGERHVYTVRGDAEPREFRSVRHLLQEAARSMVSRVHPESLKEALRWWHPPDEPSEAR